MKSIIKKIKDNKAMTLVEVLVAITITVIVIGGIYTIMVHGQRISVGQTYVAEMQQNARVAMDMMSREILMAGYDPTNPDYLVLRIPPVLDPSSTSIRVLADLNQDSDTGDANENIFFQYNSSTQELSRDSGSGAKVIAANITVFSITYDPGATTLSSTASSGDTSLGVNSTSGFDVGDWIYISDGTNLDNAFVKSIPSSTTMNIEPALTNSFSSGSAVASLEKVTISLTVQTEEKDPQTREYKTIDLVSEITLRNFSN